MDASSLLAAGALGGILAIILLVAFVLWVLLIVAHWKMFTKAGEDGWKALIPVYSDYILFKLVWSTKAFWIYVGLVVLTGVLQAMGPRYGITPEGAMVVVSEGSGIASTLGQIASFATLIVYVILNANTAIAYGKGAAFAFGLVILPNIFTMILAFGSARYRGSQR